jgi:DNA-directed RNA polymerase subunit RPC12/RpoP
MATIRCPSCGDEVVPFPLERGTDEGPTSYVCPTCRSPLTIELVDEYLAREEDEAAGA